MWVVKRWYFMASSPNHFRVVDEQFRFRKGAASDEGNAKNDEVEY